ncbi:hypothetical protein, partial [Xylophilus ampelinus]|uniref:hypothetical protein n=1 Tax=Xylophilus ampelinus TaxID=54067 RepID=UPI00216AD21A
WELLKLSVRCERPMRSVVPHPSTFDHTSVMLDGHAFQIQTKLSGFISTRVAFTSVEEMLLLQGSLQLRKPAIVRTPTTDLIFQ